MSKCEILSFNPKWGRHKHFGTRNPKCGRFSAQQKTTLRVMDSNIFLLENDMNLLVSLKQNILI